MKLNISYPANGSQKLIEIDDERKLRAFMEKRMGSEVSIIPPPFRRVSYTLQDSRLEGISTAAYYSSRKRRRNVAELILRGVFWASGQKLFRMVD
jgi:hypothetical protein